MVVQKTRLEFDIDRLRDFCKRWDISELALFGSALRDDFSDDSDVDVLVTFQPDSQHGFFELSQMQDELSQMFMREVDLVSRRGVEASRNPIRRKAILDSARVVYAEG